MKFASSIVLGMAVSVIAAPVSEAPTATIEKRADFCGQWDSYSTGAYTVYNNLWNKNTASSGSQCTGVGGLLGDTAKWHTRWSWSGANTQVKSFANIVVKLTKKAVNQYASIPTSWTWSYSGTGIVADVAYDMFTSSTASGSPQYEVMIWLAAMGGAGPISSTGSPIATPQVSGKSWKLYKGQNDQMTVFSFVAPNYVQDWDGDLKKFFDYLVQSQGLPSNQILQSIGAGTEPFVGSNAYFETSAYSVVAN